MKTLLDQKWYPVEQPWGDGTYAVAGNPDPHGGTFVFDCQNLSDVMEWEDDDFPESPQDIVQHICDVHNKSLQQGVQADAEICPECHQRKDNIIHMERCEAFDGKIRTP